jgi:hypothetical protein
MKWISGSFSRLAYTMSQPWLCVIRLFPLHPIPGFNSRAVKGFFSLRRRVQTGSGNRPASYPMGTRGSYAGIKWPGREADHSSPSSAEVKNAWSYTSTPHTSSWCGALSSTGTTLLYLLTYDAEVTTAGEAPASDLGRRPAGFPQFPMQMLRWDLTIGYDRFLPRIILPFQVDESNVKEHKTLGTIHSQRFIWDTTERNFNTRCCGAAQYHGQGTDCSRLA